VVKELSTFDDVMMLPNLASQWLINDHNFFNHQQHCTINSQDRAPNGQVAQRLHRGNGQNG